MRYYLIKLFSGLLVAFLCTLNVLISHKYTFKTKIYIKHVCVLFSGYSPLRITLLIFMPSRPQPAGGIERSSCVRLYVHLKTRLRFLAKVDSQDLLMVDISYENISH